MHKEAKMTDRDCTRACVKGGGKYGFVSEGKVINQDLPALQKGSWRIRAIVSLGTG